MPRLVERSDGCHIVRQFYHTSATWQIDADGVRYLRDRGIRVGDLFPTGVFMDMLTLGLVYTSNRPRTPQPLITGSSDPELHAHARATFGALVRRDYGSVYEALAPGLRARITTDDFVAQVLGRVVSWNLRHVRSWPWSDESTPEIDRVGTVIVDFVTVDNTGERRRYPSREEVWLHTGGAWYWLLSPIMRERRNLNRCRSG